MPVGVLLGLQSALRQNRAFAAITVFSIAASVALATSLELASRAVEALSDRTAEALAGAAQLEIVSGTLGLPERWVGEVRGVSGVASASPMLLATFGIDAARLPIHVLGIDFLEEDTSHRATLRERGVSVRDPLLLLARGDAVVVSALVSQKTGASFDQSLEVTSALGPRTLRVEGLLADRGLARAFAGQVAVMDLYALQALVERPGVVDRIEVTPTPGADLAALERELSRRLAGAATVRRTGLRASPFDQSLGALRAALWIIAATGAAVAGLLSYSAISTAVERRLPELATLRSTGFSAREVRRLVHGDALAFAALGTALGFAAGRALAGGFVPTLSRVSEYFSAGSTRDSDVRVTGTTLLLALGAGLLCALAGAVGPARLATRRWLLDEQSDSAASQKPVVARFRGLELAGLATGAFGAALVPGLPPRVALVVVLLCGTALAGRSVSPGLALLARARERASGFLPGSAHLLGTGLAARLRGTALAVASISCLVGFASGALILSASFGETLVGLVRSRYPDAIWVSPNPPFSDGAPLLMLPQAVETVRRVPGVRDVCEQYQATVLLRGEEVTLAAWQAGVALAHRNPADRPQIAAAYAGLARGEIAVSTAFARRFALSTGDSLELATPRGPQRFKIAGELYGLAGPAGIVYMDLATFDRFWQRPGATGLQLWTDADSRPVVDAIQAATYRTQPLFVTENRELLERARAFAGRFDTLLFGVVSLALVLGGVSIANLLLGVVAARRRELLLLRTAGAAPGQLAGLVLADAALIAGGSLLAGGALGALVARPMLGILRDELGLPVETHVDAARLALLGAWVLGAVLLSALYPAALAHRTDR